MEHFPTHNKETKHKRRRQPITEHFRSERYKHGQENEKINNDNKQVHIKRDMDSTKPVQT